MAREETPGEVTYPKGCGVTAEERVAVSLRAQGWWVSPERPADDDRKYGCMCRFTVLPGGNRNVQRTNH